MGCFSWLSQPVQPDAFSLAFTSSYQIIAFGLTQSQIIALAVLLMALRSSCGSNAPPQLIVKMNFLYPDFCKAHHRVAAGLAGDWLRTAVEHDEYLAFEYGKASFPADLSASTVSAPCLRRRELPLRAWNQPIDAMANYVGGPAHIQRTRAQAHADVQKTYQVTTRICICAWDYPVGRAGAGKGGGNTPALLVPPGWRLLAVG